MENNGAFCPNEECANNRGGTCGLRQAALLGMSTWAFQPMGVAGFTAPMGMGPVASLLTDDESAEAPGEGSADRGLFHNCPHTRGLRD